MGIYWWKVPYILGLKLCVKKWTRGLHKIISLSDLHYYTEYSSWPELGPYVQQDHRPCLFFDNSILFSIVRFYRPRCVGIWTKLYVEDTRHQLHCFSSSIIWLLHLCGYNNTFKRHQRIASKLLHKLLLSLLSLYSFTTCNTIDTFSVTTQILIILSCVAFRQMEFPIEMSCKKLFLLT